MSLCHTPSDYYTQRLQLLEQKMEKLNRFSAVLGWLRFLTVVVTILAVYGSWQLDLWVISLEIVAGIALFLVVVSRDTNNRDHKDNTTQLIDVIRKEVRHLHNTYENEYDGSDLQPPHHTYAGDLDLFGKSSLYQYINRCHSEKGKALLAERLLQPLLKSRILLEQEAVRELAAMPEWRHQFQAYGRNVEITGKTEKKVLDWLSQQEQDFQEAAWKPILYAYPLLTTAALLLYLADIITLSYFAPVLLAFYLFSSWISKKITPVYSLLSRVVAEINVLYRQLYWFEREPFQNRHFSAIKNGISARGQSSASNEIKTLSDILHRFDFRLNILAFFILNTFFLWDLWQLFALTKWKEENRQLVPQWFASIAEIEVANAFAALAFNHPDWCYPQIADTHFTLHGLHIGHPLIPQEKRVSNTFDIEGTGHIALITGSNMAGKSTFLRSLGINVILSLAGAPACAESFTVSVATLMTSMRISDNLVESTSTFYAELLKLKTIIEAVSRHEKVFVLLDEILRGTNSLDRHTGSKALIGQLIHQHAVAVIATHDLELAKLDAAFPDCITNYHFDVQVSGDELYFDYLLKSGVCQSMNASILMKKIGIEL